MLNNKELKILVTGGCGFIGSDFLRQFVIKYPQHTWINLDALTYAANLDSVAQLKNKSNYIFIHGNICDQKLVNELFEKYKFDIVVNFAAESHVDNSIEDPTIFINTNINGTVNLLNAAKNHGTKRFHQISTDEVYGDLPLDKPDLLFTEETPINPSSPYSSSKAAADIICSAYCRTFGMPITISRCSNNYGEFQHNEKLIPTIIRKIVNNEVIPVYGNGQNIRDWIYVGEHNLGIEAILQKGKAGHVYNLGSNNEWSNIELVELIIDKLNSSKELIEFVEDRKGHDKRYAIDFKKSYEELGWKSKFDKTNFEEKLTEVIKFYAL